jgi:hypothetical protein
VKARAQSSLADMPPGVFNFLPPGHKDTKGFFYKKFFFVFLGVLVAWWLKLELF